MPKWTLQVEQPSAQVDVHPLAAAVARTSSTTGRSWTWWTIGKAAQDDIAVCAQAQEPRGRHHPAHAKRGAELLRVAVVAWSGADHFLQRDHVGVDALQNLGDPLRRVRPSSPRHRWML